MAKAPTAIRLDGAPVTSFEYSKSGKLLWIRFANEAEPRTLQIDF